jgi:hypothetical protein
MCRNFLFSALLASLALTEVIFSLSNKNQLEFGGLSVETFEGELCGMFSDH